MSLNLMLDQGDSGGPDHFDFTTVKAKRKRGKKSKPRGGKGRRRKGTKGKEEKKKKAAFSFTRSSAWQDSIQLHY